MNDVDPIAPFENFHFEMILLVGMMITASILLLVMTSYYWHYRHKPSGKAFISVLFLCATWSLLESLKILAFDQSTKMLFLVLEYLNIALIPMTVLWAVLKFYERSDLVNRRLFGILAVVPAICIIGLLTNDHHHLFFASNEISMFDGVPILVSSYGPLFFLNEVYSYALILFSLSIIARQMQTRDGMFKKRDILVIFGISLPFAGDAAFMSGISPNPGISYAPVLLGLMAITLFFAFVRYRRFDLAPITHRIVWDNNPDPFIVMNEQKKIVDLNTNAYRILNIVPSGAIGKDVKDVLSAHPQLLEVCLLSENITKELVLTMNDSRSFFETQSITLKDQQGKNVGKLVIMRDITSRKEMDDALFLSEQKYRLLMENAPFPFAILRVQNETVMLVNNKMAELLKIDHEKIVDQPMQNFLASNYELSLLRKRLAEDGVVTEFETIMVNQRKEHFWAYLSALRIELGNETVIMLAVNDISDRKMAEALKTANRKLNLLNGITRHDLLNKLIVIGGYLKVLENIEDNQRSKEILDKLEMNTLAAHELIKFTQDYERLGVSAPVWQNVGNVVRKAQDQLDLARITMTSSLTELQVYADSMLEKVFYNLLDNSIRHGEDVKNIDISYEIEMDGTLDIIYVDDGIGLSPEDKRTLFHQGVGKNTGQGMFLTREILQITGLGISENGECGKGARFVISVPADLYNILIPDPTVSK